MVHNLSWAFLISIMKNYVYVIFLSSILGSGKSGLWSQKKKKNLHSSFCFGWKPHRNFASYQPWLIYTHLCDFLPSLLPGPEPQSWAWMTKVYSFCCSQSTRPRALSWPSPDVPFSTTALNGASSPWMLNAQISPGGQVGRTKHKWDNWSM